MNFDPYDSAAWRTFDMLDAEQAAIFDQAMRHDPVLRSAYLEMNRLSAAIAVATALPIDPPTGQLDDLQTRLGLRAPGRSHFRLALAGWATAAVLAVVLALQLTGIIDRRHPGQPTPPAISPDPLTSSAAQALAPREILAPPATAKDPDHKSNAKVETKRLNQEIEVLRDNLEKFQHRDRALFEVVPGMALPIVMSMNPPGVAAEDPAGLVKNDEPSPLTALLGDALTAMTGVSTGTPPTAANGTDTAPAPGQHPTAIPIYDAARDSGTLVVSNLPPAADGEVYNLWVTTTSGGQPVFVGSLPADCAAGADSFDFSLGSTMVLPSGFVLTRDPLDAPANPSAANTVLLGPPTPPR